ALIGAAALAAGFSAAQLRTESAGTPILERPLGPVPVEGRVVEIAPLPEAGGRVLLEDLSIARLAPEETPVRARLRIAADLDGIRPGDRITVLAELLAPPGPAAPGAFDYQRQAWFEGIGAVGFAYDGIRAHEPGPPSSGWSEFWRDLRHEATGRILAALPGPDGAIAAALMTGHQGAIPADAIQAMRDSGLAHLLSISGLHIGLIAGVLLFGLRAGIALAPWLALRIPGKKVAAVAALFGTAAYVLLAGAPVPTQRAFLMTAIVMLAVIADRSALTMRLVAWAAAAVVLIRPEAVLGASFQMSFAAVTALIAAHEALAARGHTGPATILSRIGRMLAGVALTSLVAGAATAPFAAYHFHRLADYGVLANMAAVPITGFWVMPLAVLAFALMPFGLEAMALVPMGWGIEAILAVARWVAALPGAAILIPAMPGSALAAFAAGGLWLCLWRGRWRWLGLAGLPVAGILALLYEPPDLLVTSDGAVVALRDAEGALRLSDARKGGIAVQAWLERNGQAQHLDWPEPPEAGGCDGEGCRAVLGGRSLAYALTLPAAAEDCGRADLVIAARFIPHGRCRGSILIDRGALWRAGAHALWLTQEGVRIETVRDARGERPWVVERDRPAGPGRAFAPWPDQ
ncbi:MAG TPA: ComEC/Rec2 family competence protein, partial [Alphaproteobacteria bacterium]|nr:ComEC/Rec2 family competence protein [Alphaproteobacteria bacterium]